MAERLAGELDNPASAFSPLDDEFDIWPDLSCGLQGKGGQHANLVRRGDMTPYAT